MTRSISLFLASVLLIGQGSVVFAAIDPGLRCGATKVKAAGKYVKGALDCEARAVSDAEAVNPDCVSKATDKLSATFDKAEARGGCFTAADAGPVLAVLDALTTAASDLLDPAANDEARRCAAKKLKDSSKSARKQLFCYAKFVKKGLPPEAECLTEAVAKMEFAFDKTDLRGGCTFTDDAPAMQVVLSGGVEETIAALSPVCGDGITGPTNFCDGADDDFCPAQCDLDCTCPPVCGDGILDPGEECDDANTVDADGCSGLCELEDASALCAGVETSSGTDVTAELVGFFSAPMFVTAPPLDVNRLFVVERAGRIRIFENGATLPTPFLDISSMVSTSGERGMLSMAFHPDYASNGRFFVYYNLANGDSVISRFEVSAGDPDVADLASEEVLLTIPQFADNHNGGQIQFGLDGYLYVGMGDGGGGGDPMETAQCPTSLLGKMLRLDVDVESAPFWLAPMDNPDYSTGTDPLELIWSSGLRNPWRFSFDRANGDLYIADVGQGAWEEIDYEPVTSTGGLNYGWDWREGAHDFEPGFDGTCPGPGSGFTDPIHEYDHPTGFSITGGYVYRGCRMPDLSGTYFYADFVTHFVATLRVTAGVAGDHADVTADLSASPSIDIDFISSFGEDARGELYICSIGGEVYRVVPAP